MSLDPLSDMSAFTCAADENRNQRLLLYGALYLPLLNTQGMYIRGMVAQD